MGAACLGLLAQPAEVDTDVETDIASELRIEAPVHLFTAFDDGASLIFIVFHCVSLEALPTLLFFKDGNMKCWSQPLDACTLSRPVAKVEGMVSSSWLEEWHKLSSSLRAEPSRRVQDFIEKKLLSDVDL